jgi:glycosyltransferase involved in cell wall biosynthesis
VILSALHSTGLPDHVEWPNRLLAPISDGFIGVAEAHGRSLTAAEGCPRDKVFVIPNGVDVERFQPRLPSESLRAQLGLPAEAPVAGIVAALRPEKNHELFLRVAARVREVIPEAKFLVIGDGPRREMLQSLAGELNLGGAVLFLGTRADVPELLSLLDVHVLTSHMEASPVSILEAMACGKPNVAPRVGSIPETLIDGQHGLLVNPGDEEAFAARVVELLNGPLRAAALGNAARQRVLENYSLERMVEGYEELIERIYRAKCGPASKTSRTEYSVLSTASPNH